jgi:glycosyltransferase involved in cell wall biosynthesis
MVPAWRNRPVPWGAARRLSRARDLDLHVVDRAGNRDARLPHPDEDLEHVELLQDVQVVLNSWEAYDQWRFKRARVIWHGFDPQEFPAATYERDVLSHGPDRNRPHYRGSAEFERVREALGPDIAIEAEHHLGAPLFPRDSNAYACANFRSYVDHIRSFTAYLNTTRRSPMPRSRGEAMMCGVVPVTLRNQDADHFIRHGVNGFYSDSPEELAGYLRFLCRNKEAARKIGRQARLTAMELFNHDRYLNEWTKLLGEVAG